MKRSRDARAGDEGLESRLVNLIVKVGDADVATQLPSQLEGLAEALEMDLANYHSLIVETLVDCARSLHTKATTYGTLAGLLNVADAETGRRVVEAAQQALQMALEDHAPMPIRGLTRFIAALASARVATVASAISVLEVLLSACDEQGPAARTDWFCVVVMDALVLCGKHLAAEAPGALDALVNKVSERAKARQALKTVAPLLLPYGASTSTSEVVEHFDALFTVLCTMRDDGGWSSPYLIAPHRAFAAKLDGATAHELPQLSLPAHSPGCTYPALHRLRLLSMMDAGRPADDSTMEDVDGSRERSLIPPTERILLEEAAYMLLSGFSASHRDGAKLLAALADELRVDCSAIFVEVLLSLMLCLPAPKHKQMYYACVMVDLCKLISAVPIALERALNALFARLERLDPELRSRLAAWLAIHVSNFGFSLEPFGRPWGQVLADVDDKRDEALCGTDPRVGFVRTTLDHMTRLSYLQRVSKGLPAPFAALLPPEVVGRLDWEKPEQGNAAPGSPHFLSEELLSKLRAKVADEAVITFIDGHLAPHTLYVPLVVQTLLNAGTRSVSHLEKLLDKFTWLLLHVASNDSQRAKVVGAACRFWSASNHMALIVCRKLIKHGVIDAAAIIAYAFSPEARSGLGGGTREGPGWELLYEAFDGCVTRQRDGAVRLRKIERRLDDLVRDRADGREIAATEDDLGRAKHELDQARRDQKQAFADFFACACKVLSEEHGGASFDQTWRATCVGHVHAVGRLYCNDINLEAIEMIAQGDGTLTSVREDVFSPLRQVQFYCGS